MIIDTGRMTLEISIVEYIEKVEDEKKDYGVKIVFLAETNKEPKVVYFKYESDRDDYYNLIFKAMAKN
jgi:hypothetical protein